MPETTTLNNSLMRAVMRMALRCLLKPVLGAGLPVSVQRRVIGMVTLINRPPGGVTVSAIDMAGVPGLHISPAGQQGNSDTALLYLHGGGYVFGASKGYRNVGGHIALATQSDVYMADYRLAPEHPCPAAVDDALDAYQWLLQQGYAPEKIAIGGDSAGGGLALAAAVELRDRKLLQPAALMLISPWLDLTLSGESIAVKANVDPLLQRSWLARSARQYMQDQPLDSPAGSPLFAQLAGLPNLIIHCGADEILLDDSLRLAHRAMVAGLEVHYRVYADLWHEFHIHAGLMPESRIALDDLSEQLRLAWSND